MFPIAGRKVPGRVYPIARRTLRRGAAVSTQLRDENISGQYSGSRSYQKGFDEVFPWAQLKKGFAQSYRAVTTPAAMVNTQTSTPVPKKKKHRKHEIAAPYETNSITIIQRTS
jgi:hypothetical protein